MIIRGEYRYSIIIRRRKGEESNLFLSMVFLDSDQLSIQLLLPMKYGFLSVNTSALV